jgi:hypothetical protein
MLFRLSTWSGKASPDIDTGALNGPHGLAFMGGKLWFTAEGAKAVASYDPASAKIDWIMGTGQNRTHMIYVARDEKHIYTTSVSSGTIISGSQIKFSVIAKARERSALRVGRLTTPISVQAEFDAN